MQNLSCAVTIPSRDPRWPFFVDCGTMLKTRQEAEVLARCKDSNCSLFKDFSDRLAVIWLDRRVKVTERWKGEQCVDFVSLVRALKMAEKIEYTRCRMFKRRVYRRYRNSIRYMGKISAGVVFSPTKFRKPPRNQDKIFPLYLILATEDRTNMTIYFLNNPKSMEPSCREENIKCRPTFRRSIS